MNTRNTLFILTLALMVLVATACGASATATPTPKPTVPVSPTAPPTATSVPSPTSVPIPPTPVPPTATPVPPKATTKQQVNMRQGPGTQFTIAGQMPKSTSATILGKNEDGQWLQVTFPDAAHPAWVASAFVTVTGTIDSLPVVAVAPPPTATAGAVAATKVPVTPTVAVPAAKGTMDFVSFDAAQSSFVLSNLAVTTHAISGDRLLGPRPGPVDVRNGTNASLFAVSPVDGRLAYVYSSNGLVDVLNVTDSGGTAKPIVSHGGASAPGGISSPTWSPDGSMVAYIGIDQNYSTQVIYTIPAGGGPENKFFLARYSQERQSGETLRGLAWGKTHFLFVSDFTGSSEIWRLNSDGSGALQMTTDKTEDGSPSWSPDGKQFAYYSKQANGYQIMVRNLDGSGARALTKTGNNWSPVWSPDGNWIAFSSDRGGNGRRDVYMMDKNGGNVQLLTDKSPVEAILPGAWR
jgi:Tol biopolymer transport system component